MSSLVSLPRNLKLPFIYQDRELDLENWSPLHINNDGDLILEVKDGTLKPKSQRSILELLSKYSCIFTYTPPGKIDSLLSLLPDKDLVTLHLFHQLEYNGYIIRKMRNFLSINTTPIINLINTTKTYKGESLESINSTANEVINSRQNTFGLYNLSSMASEARALMLNYDEILDELWLVRRLGMNNLDKFNAACYGGRMESSGIGTEYQWHYDMVKAHLNILKEYPGIRNTTWVRGQTASRFYEKALPNSIYYIKTDVSNNRKYNPLPVRTEAGIKYPSGRITGWYYKDYLSLLEELGIKFTILDSVQFLGEGTYPFKSLTTLISGLIKLFEEQYPNLETKHLYATIAGSCKGIYRNINKELAEVQVASRCFDPLVYGFVLTRQNVKVYKESENASAIKIDSIALSKSSTLPEEFQVKSVGLSTYLTPALKSLPDSEKNLYKTSIQRCRDLSYVELEINSWNGLSSYLNDNPRKEQTTVGLGKKYKNIIRIKPNYGNRSGHRIKRVGDLLHTWFISSPSETATPEDYNLLQLEEYKRRFG